MRIGFGVDVHAFGAGEFIMLGGVRIPHSRGVVAHSDGDVMLHALCDALLGAAGLGDIGQHFSDTDPQWQGADSRRFVVSVLALLHARRLAVANVDLTVLAQAPKIAPIARPSGGRSRSCWKSARSASTSRRPPPRVWASSAARRALPHRPWCC